MPTDAYFLTFLFLLLSGSLLLSYPMSNDEDNDIFVKL